MSRQSRIEKLEAAVRERGGCVCPNPSAVYYEDEPAPAPTCATCGGEKVVFHVVYEKDWRAAA